jgi:hypothetical protein
MKYTFNKDVDFEWSHFLTTTLGGGDRYLVTWRPLRALIVDVLAGWLFFESTYTCRASTYTQRIHINMNRWNDINHTCRLKGDYDIRCVSLAV